VKRARAAQLDELGDDQPGNASNDSKDGATLRQCAVTRAERSIAALIRFVAAPDGQITPDLACKLPGRGVWITATRDAVTQAVKRNVFAKSLKRPVSIPDDLIGLVDRLLALKARQSLSIANKAGLVTTGFMKVSEALDSGPIAALIAASDAAPDGVNKLERKFRAIRTAGTVDGLEPVNIAGLILTDFTGEELDLAFGRSNVIHAALATGAQSRIVLNDSLRLRRFRSNTVLEESLDVVMTPAPDGLSGSGGRHADENNVDGSAAIDAGSEQGGTDTV
jgi:uncharacterized protein